MAASLCRPVDRGQPGFLWGKEAHGSRPARGSDQTFSVTGKSKSKLNNRIMIAIAKRRAKSAPRVGEMSLKIRPKRLPIYRPNP
jgi:hypothetical protein